MSKILYFTAGILLSILLCHAFEDCSGHWYNKCYWGHWHQWSSCSKSCGGGVRERKRLPCCAGGQMESGHCFPYECGKHYTLGWNYEYLRCNDFCYHGNIQEGTLPDPSSCRCPDEYYGTCCAAGNAIWIAYMYQISPSFLNHCMCNTPVIWQAGVVVSTFQVKRI